ncbi:MAG TPA: 3-phosphoshikimate 1-carboxyvinyltransferase [Candidatus Saccharimonadales bacterium]|nr:3-phosphoshikimate 1-carboxyvinyltransferase [Candidatus Saccharimonadales bacterium]
MKQVIIYPLKDKIDAEVIIPGCIGYTIRALNIAAMTSGSVKILNPLKSDDIYSMVNALKSLGIEIIESENNFTVIGDISDIKNKNYTIDIGLSGRTARTLLALLCIVPGEKVLTCHEEFKKRPVGDLVEGLRQIGAKIEYLEKENHLPVKISDTYLNSGTISMNGELSSQYFSALMMIAPIVGDMIINVNGNQSSKPFIDMTIDIMKNFGIKIENNNYKHYKIVTGQTYINPENYLVEPEATSASYFWAMAAITESKIKVLNLGPNSRQGDIKFVDVLEEMGCKINKNTEENWIEVEGSRELKSTNADMNDTPDLVPTLAVVAAFAKGQTIITNIAHAKIKETDRIEAPKNELLKMGIIAESTDSSLIINGGSPLGSEIETYSDHRMAMSFAVAGTKIAGISINNPDVVNKSFPDFWKKLEEIGVKIERSAN